MGLEEGIPIKLLITVYEMKESYLSTQFDLVLKIANKCENSLRKATNTSLHFTLLSLA